METKKNYTYTTPNSHHEFYRLVTYARNKEEAVEQMSALACSAIKQDAGNNFTSLALRL